MQAFNNFLSMLFMLLVAHVVCDYPLQGDFLSRAKNHRNPIAGVPWWQALVAHAIIHAGAVYLVTKSPVWAAVELVVHTDTDYQKCDGFLTFNQDQFCHVITKVGIAFMVVYIG